MTQAFGGFLLLLGGGWSVAVVLAVGQVVVPGSDVSFSVWKS